MAEVEITLADGRRLGVREVDAGDMLDVIEAAGHAAGSDPWMHYALTICAVRSIDGVPVRLPASKDAMRDLARRLGGDALDRVAVELSQAAGDEDLAVVKN